MLKIKGTVITKEQKIRPVRVEILIEDDSGASYSLQLRPKNFVKLTNIDVGAKLAFTVENVLSEAEKIRINNLIVVDAERL